MILSLLLAVQVVAPPDTSPGLHAGDSIPVVTLPEALQLATSLDPNYVFAVGQVDNAEWGRRIAITAFILPSVTLNTSYTASSTPQFNIGTGGVSKNFVGASVDARYELFAGGRRIFDAQRASADLEGAEANELEARLLSALATERAYYDVLGSRELLVTADARVRRAEEQVSTARARVLSGAAVQSDSLQLMLELARARVEQLRQRSQLTVARLELGRRIGLTGSADAAPLAEELPTVPIGREEAVQLALEQGPAYRVARADERAAAAEVRARWSSYLPTVTLSGQAASYDTEYWPTATGRQSLTIAASWPLWNGGFRELALSQARVNSRVASAIRDDLERAARRDVIQAYEAFEVSVASSRLAEDAVVVAQENYRVQDARYRAGASTILDLLEAQVSLNDAESGYVQARYAAFLSRAGLEVIVGRRFSTGSDQQ